MRSCRSLTLLALLILCGCTVSSSGISFNWVRPSPRVVTPDVVEPEIVGDEFRCLIIEDEPQRSKLPRVQLDMLTSKNTRDFLNANCVKDDKGNPQYRIVDKRTALTGVWDDMKTKYPPDSFPWLILTNGANGTGEPLPRDWETLQAVLHKYAGVR